MDKVEMLRAGMHGDHIAKEMPPFPFYVRGNSGALWKITDWAGISRRMHNGEPMVKGEIVADGNVGFSDTLHADQLLAMYGEFNENGEQIKSGYLDENDQKDNRELSSQTHASEQAAYKKQHTNLN